MGGVTCRVTFTCIWWLLWQAVCRNGWGGPILALIAQMWLENATLNLRVFIFLQFRGVGLKMAISWSKMLHCRFVNEWMCFWVHECVYSTCKWVECHAAVWNNWCWTRMKTDYHTCTRGTPELGLKISVLGKCSTGCKISPSLLKTNQSAFLEMNKLALICTSSIHFLGCTLMVEHN